MSKREAILDAARELFWVSGFEATSPRHIMDKSGAGQGSLYHHFATKKVLASVVLEELADELLAVSASLLTDERRSSLERVRAYLLQPRSAARGCRLGRFVNERSVVEDADLQQPIARYLLGVRDQLAACLREGQERGEVAAHLDDEAAAALVLAQVQGAYVLARGTGDDRLLQQALATAAALVEGWAA
jgi:TetR/AcrR family transcriptional repressor of nem operon